MDMLRPKKDNVHQNEQKLTEWQMVKKILHALRLVSVPFIFEHTFVTVVLCMFSMLLKIFCNTYTYLYNIGINIYIALKRL